MLQSVLIGVFTLLTGMGGVTAQSNENLDALLAQAPARVDSVVYLVMAAGGLVTEETELATAFQAGVSAGYLAPNKKPEDSVNLEELSYLVMKALRIGGGLQWTLLPNPRAAYQELSFHGLLNTSSGPGRLVAGDEVVRTVDAVLAWKGARQ